MTNPTSKNDDSAPAAVVKASQAWLALLDNGSYPKAWEEAAPSMHFCISQTDFDTSIRNNRGPFGKMEIRDTKSKRYLLHSPGLPEGDCWIISYTTRFENKANVVESLVLTPEGNGNWRVAGYTLP